jgi:carbon storage regulator
VRCEVNNAITEHGYKADTQTRKRQMVMMTRWKKKKDTRTLVLSRKQEESVLIGDNVRVTISQIRGNRVTIAIQAPDGVKIMRSEVVETEPSSDAG